MEAMRTALFGSQHHVLVARRTCVHADAAPQRRRVLRRRVPLQGLCHLEIVHAVSPHVRSARRRPLPDLAACRTAAVAQPRIRPSGAQRCAMLQSDEALALMFPDGVR